MSSNRPTTYEFRADASQAGGEIDRNLTSRYTAAAQAAQSSAASQTAALRAVGLELAAVREGVRNYDAELANNRSELAATQRLLNEMRGTYRSNAEEVRNLKKEIDELRNSARDMRAEKGQLRV